MGLVNKLLLLYEECQAEGRDVNLSIELRGGVELFSFGNTLHPSSTPQLPSRSSRRRRRRQRGPRIRNDENYLDAVLPRRGRAPATRPRRGPSPALYPRRGRDSVGIPRRGQDDAEIPISGRSAQVLPRRDRTAPALPRRGLVSKEADMSQHSLGEVYTPNRSQREVELPRRSPEGDKKHPGPQHRPHVHVRNPSNWWRDRCISERPSPRGSRGRSSPSCSRPCNWPRPSNIRGLHALLRSV